MTAMTTETTSMTEDVYTTIWSRTSLLVSQASCKLIYSLLKDIVNTYVILFNILTIVAWLDKNETTPFLFFLVYDYLLLTFYQSRGDTLLILNH